tara:strand:+ start:432 stop:761 length:330 start_codon:yes stop_codon:yes gene_type:complete
METYSKYTVIKNVKIEYRTGLKETKTVEGNIVTAGGIFNDFWAVDTGEKEITCIPRMGIINIKTIIPKTYLMPVEEIEEMEEIHELERKQHLMNMKRDLNKDDSPMMCN